MIEREWQNDSHGKVKYDAKNIFVGYRKEKNCNKHTEVNTGRLVMPDTLWSSSNTHGTQKKKRQKHENLKINKGYTRG